MVILLGFLRFAWPYLLGAAVFLGAYAFVYHKGVAAEKVHTDAAVAALKAYQEKQRAYAAQLVLDYQAATGRAETSQKELDNERTKSFAGIKNDARSVAGRSTPLPAAFVGVLKRAVDTANAAPTAPEPS